MIEECYMSEIKEFDRENFTESVEAGEKGEIEIYNFLKRGGYKFIHKLPGKNSDYDYKCIMVREGNQFHMKEHTFEFKTDFFGPGTGNIGVEFNQYPFGGSKKPSGISVTKADYFVTYFKNFGQVWKIKTEDLKFIIKDMSERFPKNCRIVEKIASESNPTDMYLMNRVVLMREYSNLIDVREYDTGKKYNKNTIF